MLPNNKSKFQGRAEDYLEWFKLGYEAENRILVPAHSKAVQEEKYGRAAVRRVTSASIPAYQNSKLGKSYTDKYLRKHLEEYENAPPSAYSRREVHDRLEEISTVAGTDFGDSDESDTDAEKMQIYNHYDFSKFIEATRLLPIYDYEKEILQKIETYSVVVIHGITGCGKSTQVPQYILDDAVRNERHVNIIVTQPRKIAAISLATRVCQERGWRLGSLVGYQIGLNNATGSDTRLTFVTTEVLVQKVIHKKSLNDFTHIILDEVHERDEQTDFALLVVKKLLHTVSRNVKVILMSATIDCTKFASYFAVPVGGTLIKAPVISVADKIIHKVQVFYLGQLQKAWTNGQMPSYSRDEPGVSLEMYSTAVKIIESLDRIEKAEENSKDTEFPHSRGSVLIFLPGLHEIETLIEELMKNKKHQTLLWDCIPIHSSLTLEEQQKAFLMPNKNHRKIIVSTNIAESSVTVVDVKYVIDFCLTKILYCDPATNYSCLKMAWASKASCNQRKGRTGRVGPGRVYRLVEEDFFQELNDYIMPELCRTPLTRLVLKTKLLDMGTPESLLALAMDPPNLQDIYRTVLVLKQIGALALKTNGEVSCIDGNMTYLGKVAAHLPLDVRLSKLIVLGHVFGCLDEMVIIAASLSLKSFHATPFRKEMDAFLSKHSWAFGSFSDCLASLHCYQMWEQFNIQGKFLPRSSSKERDWAREHFVQLDALRDVSLLVKELKQRLEKLKIVSGRVLPNSNDVNSIMLKLSITGAFFPYYYKKVKHDDLEKTISLELSGNDPFKTVIVGGFPADSNFIYHNQLKEMFKFCSENPEIVFEGRKAYIQFGSEALGDRQGKYDIPGKFPPEMYLALKMRQITYLRENLILNLYSPEDAKIKMTEYKIMGMSSSFDDTYKRKVQQHATGLANPEFPGPFATAGLVLVTCVDDPEHFWVVSKEPNTLKQMKFVEQTISLLTESCSIQPLVEEITHGLICLAPYEDNTGEKYYRAKVEEIRRTGPDTGVPRGTKEAAEVVAVLVYFVDYGNKGIVKPGQLRKIPSQLLSVPVLSTECSLINVKPIDRAKWSPRCIDWIREEILEKELHVQVYSVVYGTVARVELYSDGAELTFNQMLVRLKYAIEADEPKHSKDNHKLRTLLLPEFGEMEKQKEKRMLSGIPSNISFSGSLRQFSHKATARQLYGPSSPLEMKFSALTKTGFSKGVRVERSSVNSLVLDSYYDNPFDRMIVSSFVSLNPSGNAVSLRNTTLMSPIPGFLGLNLLLFSPACELRVNECKSAVTGAIFGLGYDPKTGQSIYPDEDIEITFDFNFHLDDLKQVNAIRYLMSSALDTLEDITPKALFDYQRALRERVTELLATNREYKEPIYFANTFKWNQLEEKYIKYPSTRTGLENNEGVIFPLHCALVLEDDTGQQAIHIKVVKLRKLESKLNKEKTAPSAEINETCPICPSTVLATFLELQMHLKEKNHALKEWQILTEIKKKESD